MRIGEARRVIDVFPPMEDLVWLFESEPIYPFGAETWPYAPVRFVLDRGADRIEVEIEPAEGSVTIELHRGGQQTLNLGLRHVRGLGTERRPDRELLHVDFDEAVPADALWLQTKPTVALTWQLTSH